MDWNNSNFSEIKLKRERFSVEIRRMAQLKAFSRSRNHLVGHPHSFVHLPKEKGSEINSVRRDFFEKTKRELISAFNDGNISELRSILLKIREDSTKNSKVGSGSFDEFYDSDLPTILFDLIKNESLFADPFVLNEVLWILSNASAATADQISQLIALGIFDLVKQVLLNPQVNLTEHALYVLSNIVGEHPDFKLQIDNHNLWPMTFIAIEKFSMYPNIAKSGCWFYSNALRGPPYAHTSLVF